MQPGEEWVYYVGNLAERCYYDEVLAGTRNGIYLSYLSGKCLLTQRRIDNLACEYIAKRRSNRHVH